MSADSPFAVIVEDEPLLRQELRDQLAAEWPALRIAAEAADGIEGLRAITEHQPQVVFLDVRIPGLSGLELAELVSSRCHVVFVTAYQEHAVAAFEQGAVDYIVKPLEASRLRTTVARLKDRLREAPQDLTGLLAQLRVTLPAERIRWLQASAGNKIRVIPTEDVIFFQSESKYTKVVTDRGETHIRRTIKELSERLDADAFWQVSRGVIVNVARIEEVVRNGEVLEVRMRGRDERLAVSHAFHHLFRRS
jgi:DNA-binding LytR/AlgR family response regulator